MDPATLDTLIGLAATKCDAAQAHHAMLLRSAQQAAANLQTLRQYAGEYDERARCRPGDARDPSAEHNQTIFLARLGHAVDAQARELEIRESAVAAAAADLALAQQKRKSLETLAARRREDDRRKAARRDQKLTDEFAQRASERAAAIGLSTHMIAEGTGT